MKPQMRGHPEWLWCRAPDGCPARSRMGAPGPSHGVHPPGSRPMPVTMLPAMPWLTTDSLNELRVSRAIKRRWRSSGQRSLPLMEEKKPLVIESPNATTVAALGRLTSRPEMKNHEVVGVRESSVAAVGRVVPGSGVGQVGGGERGACQVIGPLVPLTKTETAKLRVVRVATRSRTGSLSRSLPAGTVTERWPENVSVRLVPGAMVPAIF
jgi:hypothetical protein